MRSERDALFNQQYNAWAQTRQGALEAMMGYAGMQHGVIPQPAPFKKCRLPECDDRASSGQSEGYCVTHFRNLLTWYTPKTRNVHA